MIINIIWKGEWRVSLERDEVPINYQREVAGYWMSRELTFIG